MTRAAVRATYLAFLGNGFVFASWASRIPQVRATLDLSPAQLGLVLLCLAAGSVISLPLSGPLVARVGSRRTVAVMSVVMGLAVAAVALAQQVGVAPLAVALFGMGFGQGAWDVGMNVQGAAVERATGRPIMPRFHAGFSLGTVIGALVGAALVALHVPVSSHLLVVAAIVAVVVPWGSRGFLPDADPDDGTTDGDPTPVRALAAWTEPRTLLVGLVVLAFAFAEGTANDWVGVALIDGYGAPAAVGTLGLAVFLAAMTGARWIGPALLERHGRVGLVRVLAGIAVVGLALFVFGGSTPVAFVGAVLWGAGTSLGFPVGMSAAADDPARAASRVSVVASIGYCAFLAGPPLIGFLGDRTTVLHALTVVAVLLAVATFGAGALQQLPGDVSSEPALRAGR